MIVIFIRHAARSNTSFAQVAAGHGDDDPSLNDLGRAQALALAAAAKDAIKIMAPTHLFASPKKRAQQTLEPTASALSLKIKIDARLDECRSGESSSDLNKRILTFVNEFENEALLPEAKAKCVYACSHFDWLEYVLPLLPSDLNDYEIARGWGNCEYRAFDVSPGLWKFVKGGKIQAGG